MTQFEQEQASKKFVEIWKDKGNERAEAQKFWKFFGNFFR